MGLNVYVKNETAENLEISDIGYTLDPAEEINLCDYYENGNDAIQALMVQSTTALYQNRISENISYRVEETSTMPWEI